MSDERRVVRVAQIQRTFLLPFLIAMSMSTMAVPYLPSPLRAWQFALLALPAVSILGLVRVRRASSKIRERMVGSHSDSARHRVRMDLWRGEAYLGSDFGSLAFADGRLAYSGLAVSFSFPPSDVVGHPKTDTDIHRREFVEMPLADGSMVRFQALDWFPVGPRVPRGAPPYAPSEDGLIAEFSRWHTSNSATQPAAPPIFPPEHPLTTTMSPPWRAAAWTQCLLLSAQIALAAMLVVNPNLPGARDYGPVAISLLVALWTVLSLPLLLQGFPSLRDSSLGRAVIAHSPHAWRENGFVPAPTPPKRG